MAEAKMKLSELLKKHGIKMQRKLAIYWISMALVIFLSILLILGMTKNLMGTDQRVQNELQLQQENTANAIFNHADALSAQCMNLSEKVSRELKALLNEEGITFQELNDNPDALHRLQQNIYPAVDTALQVGQCSGVYVVLDATTNTEASGSKSSKTGIYLRLEHVGSVKQQPKTVTFFRGNPDIARAENIPMHNRWNLEFDSSVLPFYSDLIGEPVSRLADCIFWESKAPVKDTREYAIFLYVPILDENHRICGFCGVEISALYFRMSFPGVESSYGSMMTLLAPMQNGNPDFHRAMLGGNSDVTLQNASEMTLEQGKKYNIYRVGDQAYAGVQIPTRMKCTPGADEKDTIQLITLLPGNEISAMRSAHTVAWVCGSVLFLIMIVLVSIVLSKHFARPIIKSLDAMRTEEGESPKSGIKEIDDLLAEIRERSKKTGDLHDQELPPDVEELFQRFRTGVKSLTPTEWMMFQHYIDGYDIEEAANLAYISVNTAKKHNTNINRKLGVTSREELMLYIDLFRRCGRLDEITYHD